MASSTSIPHEYPLVLGRDTAGVVEAVGAGVTHVSPGDEVIGHVLLAPPIKAGTLAEYALLPAAAVTAKPAGLDFVTAAALPLAGATAYAAVEAVGPERGQVILVVGAGGGVGSFAVQLLARNVTVIATGTPADADRLTGLGAATVIDYTAGPVTDQVRAIYPEGVDALIDLVSHSADELPLDAVRKGGKVASTLSAADEDVLAAAGLTGSNIRGAAVREVVAPLAEQVAAGILKVTVSAVLALDEATDGLATIAAGKSQGKIVVKVSD